MPFGNNVTKRLLVALVNLVDEQQHRDGHLADFLKEIRVLLRILHDIRDIEKHISICKCGLRECKHHLLHLIVGLKDAWSVGEHYLHVVGIDNAHYAVTSGLSLKSGYGDTLANQLVHQCRLADIGISYDVYKTCLVHVSILVKTKKRIRLFVKIRMRFLVIVYNRYFFDDNESPS